MARLSRRRPHFTHPTQAIVAGFAAMIIVGTIILMLPISSTDPDGATFVEALFTATSAVCIVGLIVVDTPEFWTTFGEVAIMVMFQVGGFGIMTMGSLFVVLISRRIKLSSRLTAAAETKSLGLGDVRRVVTGVAKVSFLFESATFVILTLRLVIGYDEPLGRAAYVGLFHAVSAFNNSGFSLYSNSLEDFVVDPWITLPVAIAAICGGIGFPVLLELRRQIGNPRNWSLHTKLTVSMTLLLLPLGSGFMMLSEWNNDATMGTLDVPGKILSGFFHGAMPRSTGFNSLDVEQMNEATWLGTDVLMFIGAGSAGTGGGIKVTTFALLFFVIYAEIRGEPRVNIFDRQVSPRVQRQGLTIALLTIALCVGPTVFILLVEDAFPLDRVLFEVISAACTVGLSTGITSELHGGIQVLLVVLMFIGRLGPAVVATALALRQHTRLYELPEGRPIIG
ncbi:TrkH family potassium uptake protein [Actinobacteria bacterium YIM 96077]|uniref:TrkH family potassium uptake protein n=1 Tax=Phytoactinopolyspora halophila TaxID=1981511 RepID=A0A329QZ42_9ACTN|nr:TrkH family potassium uptake protein [Actinobacteria bacterium YIM 96077]RAW17684.1 TrkH family potassium uptake protein [Phytoactinopolyspora halophila]